MSKAWGPVWLWCLGIFLLSHQSSPLSFLPRWILFPHADKAIHFWTYAVMGLLSARAVGLRSPRLSPGARMLAAVLVAALYGFFDEFHQMFVPKRSPDILDFLADALGGLTGAAVFIRLTDSGDGARPAPSSSVTS